MKLILENVLTKSQSLRITGEWRKVLFGITKLLSKLKLNLMILKTILFVFMPT